MNETRWGREEGGIEEVLNNDSFHDMLRTGVIDIGLKSVGFDGVETLAIGRIKACFHCSGTVEVDSERLKSRVIGS